MCKCIEDDKGDNWLEYNVQYKWRGNGSTLWRQAEKASRGGSTNWVFKDAQKLTQVKTRAEGVKTGYSKQRGQQRHRDTLEMAGVRMFINLHLSWYKLYDFEHERCIHFRKERVITDVKWDKILKVSIDLNHPEVPVERGQGWGG